MFAIPPPPHLVLNSPCNWMAVQTLTGLRGSQEVIHSSVEHQQRSSLHILQLGGKLMQHVEHGVVPLLDSQDGSLPETASPAAGVGV